MSDSPVITARGLGKRYRIWTHSRPTSLSDRVELLAGRLRPRPGATPATTREEVWALRDVSFDVFRGEVLGVIGPNGAGKSTLLSILARITEPTSGYAELHGRVSSLLEVGTGFHPELSGRDNVYLNGAILGMSRRETAEKFEQIVEFSGVGDFIDMPVKRYSSGMHVRLAFAVAAHLDPEILLLDEVLAVGDSAFQEKCLRRIHELTQSGRTVLFVSHTPAAVAQLCTRALVVNGGAVVFDGEVDEALERYLGSPQIDGGPSAFDQQAMIREGTGELRVTGARVTGPNGDAPVSERPVRIELELVPARPTTSVDLSVVIGVGNPASGEPLTVAWRADDGAVLQALGRGDPVTLACELEHLPIRPGRYVLSVTVERGSELLDACRHQAEFTLDPQRFALHEATGREVHPSLVVVPHHWEVGVGHVARTAVPS